MPDDAKTRTDMRIYNPKGIYAIRALGAGILKQMYIGLNTKPLSREGNTSYMAEEQASQGDQRHSDSHVDSFRAGYEACLRKMMSSGQMKGVAVANELLLLLPPEFVQAYEELFWRALADPSSVQRKEGLDKAKGQTGTVLGSESQLQASGTGKRFRNTGFLVKSDKALARKTWVDQKLMGLVDDIRASLRGESLKTRQCKGVRCKRMLDRKWDYCPSCGTKV